MILMKLKFSNYDAIDLKFQSENNFVLRCFCICSRISMPDKDDLLLKRKWPTKRLFSDIIYYRLENVFHKTWTSFTLTVVDYLCNFPIRWKVFFPLQMHFSLELGFGLHFERPAQPRETIHGGTSLGTATHILAKS